MPDYIRWQRRLNIILVVMTRGLRSIDTAMKLAPDDMFHIIDRAEFHLVLGESHLVIGILKPFADGSRFGTRGALYLAIAHAIEEKYDDANTHLGAAIRADNSRTGAAEFVRLVVGGLEGFGVQTLDAGALHSILCVDTLLHSALLSETQYVEPHVFGLKMLIGRLDDSNREMIRSAMETPKCA